MHGVACLFVFLSNSLRQKKKKKKEDVELTYIQSHVTINHEPTALRLGARKFEVKILRLVFE
jgi:hypothetical protein